LQLDDFRLERAILEVKYENALLLWDRSGSLWTEVGAALNGVKVIQAQPNATIFAAGENKELFCGLDAARVIEHRPSRRLAEFSKCVDDVFPLLFKNLGIKSLSRVGFRLIFFRQCSDIVEASSLVLGLGRLTVPKEKLFGAEGPPLFPEFAFRFKGAARSTTFRARADERRLEINMPPEIDVAAFGTLERRAVTLEGIVLDIDHFAHGAVLVDQLKPSEFVGTAMHLVRRDGDSLLKGQR
jgi:hypothetical protein